MASNGSKMAIFAAIGANSLVTVAKLAGFAMTGSGAMLSEGMHSLADVGNQSLLAVGLKMSQKPADEDHPEGYGPEAFIWALVSAVGIFFMGAGVSITHGVQALFAEGHHGEGSTNWSWAIGILVFSLVIESLSFGVAAKGMYDDAKSHGQGLLEYLWTTDDPFGVAVIMRTPRR